MTSKEVPFGVTDWKDIPPVEHKGELGSSFWRDLDVGNVHVHLAEYSPGYKADGWCSTGHILYVLKGQLITELKDGRVFTINAGQSYQVSDSVSNPHRSRTDGGATLFIVDWPA